VTPDEALEAARSAGIHRLRIPTPFAVGRVNCYLLEDEPLSLIDTGPNSGKSLDELQRQLEQAHHAIEEIELIVITHQHLDHLGLVEIVASRSGAEVAAIDVVVPFVEHFGDDIERDDEFAAALMRRYGIPDDVVAALRSVSRSFRGWGARADVTRPLADGETIRLRDRALEVQHRPGHSPSDTLFWDPERAMLICGDHLIAHISSNPLISRPLDGSSEREAAQGEGVAGKDDSGPSAKAQMLRRPQALVAYIESLRRTRGLDAEILLPGHGEPITNHRELIDERFALHRRRAERIEALIAERSLSPYELAQEIWGNVAVTQAFLTLSEVIGHVDLLINAGRVREAEDDAGVVRFEVTGEGGDLDIPEPVAASNRVESTG
jgi:glyoxylase-like metal-dependent hydrolase (beta-lactamase superfamily II)